MNEREIKELLELTRENNKLLHKIRRHAVWGSVFSILYWAFILGVPVVLYYYYLQPYLGQVLDTYSGIQNEINNSLQETGDQTKKLGDLFGIFGIGR